MNKRQNTYYTQFDLSYSLSNKNFQTIIDFYLFNCPVSGKSFRGKTFEEYGFKSKAPFSRLKAEMLNSATESLKANYKPCKKEELEKNFQLAEAVSPPDEYCVFLKSDGKNTIKSLFSAIRNAFAHGSFNVKKYGGTRIYFLLNEKGYRKAQIVLHEETLLAWIKIIQSGYQAMLNNRNK